MLQPKRTKFRKKQKGRVKGIAQRGLEGPQHPRKVSFRKGWKS